MMKVLFCVFISLIFAPVGFAAEKEDLFIKITSIENKKDCDFNSKDYKQFDLMKKSILREKSVDHGFSCSSLLPEDSFDHCVLTGFDNTEGKGGCQVSIKKERIRLETLANNGSFFCEYHCFIAPTAEAPAQ